MIKSKKILKHIDKLIEITKNKHNKPVYWFQCTTCNTKCAPRKESLDKDKVLCKKCANKGRPHEYAYNNLLKKSNKKVDLTYEDFATLCEEKSCHYCLRQLDRIKHRTCGKPGTGYMLDRKDNLLDYTKENTVVCCWPCNNLKSNRFTYSEFLKISAFLIRESISPGKIS